MYVYIYDYVLSFFHPRRHVAILLLTSTSPGLNDQYVPNKPQTQTDNKATTRGGHKLRGQN